MAVDRLFDLPRIDFEPRDIDQVLDAIDHEDEAVLVEISDIARAQEPVDESRFGVFRAVPISLHHLRTLDADLARLAERHLAVGIIETANRNDGARQWLTDRAVLLGAAERVQGDDRRCLGKAISLHQTASRKML